LEHVENHPRDLSKLAANRFDITRQAVSKHLRRLVQEKLLSESGETRNRTYKLVPLVEWKKLYPITPDLEEHVLWDQDIAPTLGSMPENIVDIWRYGFTEIINNAKDHSGGKTVFVGIAKNAVSTLVHISDDGIGIFKKIQQALNLPDQRYAVLELAKGKLTTDPDHHTGEGLFFASRMFDKFSIGFDQTWLGYSIDDEHDWIYEASFPNGTDVFMALGNHSRRTVEEVFNKEDYRFNKTVVPVKLAQYGNDKLISRSQAKRVVSRLELFKTILFDFTGVPTIGQAFADEIFRVFAKEHPGIEIYPIHANSQVNRMIARVTSTTPAIPASGTPQIS
jgi:DNA-binding transcriptional ArsR family regulator